MSKKKTGLFIALGAVLGAAAACVSYYLKFKSFSDELDKDFHDYEDEEDTEPEKPEPEPAKRNYITIDGGKCKSEEEKDVSVSEEKDSAAPASLETEAVSQKPVIDVTVEEDTDEAKA